MHIYYPCVSADQESYLGFPKGCNQGVGWAAFSSGEMANEPTSHPYVKTFM